MSACLVDRKVTLLSPGQVNLPNKDVIQFQSSVKIALKQNIRGMEYLWILNISDSALRMNAKSK